MSVRIICADVMDGLRQLPDESVHCVVTSPPYWGLRSYLPKCHPLKHMEIGSEPTLQEHIAKLVGVFSEVRRVLRKDGTLWLNYGDMWANDGKFGGESGGKHAYHNDDNRKRIGREKRRSGLKPKDLCMAPHRLAIALQDDGWWVRSDIVWHKPNPMPSSVKDRPTPAKEFVFLLSKSARYFYDGDSIAEARVGDEDANTFRGGSYTGGEPGPRKVVGNKKYAEQKNQASPDRRRSGFNERWDREEVRISEARKGLPSATYCRHRSSIPGGQSLEGMPGETRNARDVWTIATQPFLGAHYATFPCALAERCIKASCPVGGTVLDPFGGAGTVGLVASRLQRNAILIDLDPANRLMAERRIKADAPLFAEVAA